MTFSILAREPNSGAFGIAIASRFFAVGAVCPFVFPGLGAFSTQASGHPPFGAEVEQLLMQGLTPEAVLAELLTNDPSRDLRQLHLIDADGRIATHNGDAIRGASGHREAMNVSIAGNMLVSADVLEAARDAYVGNAGSLAERLLLALEAGHAAGGDERGQQAASLLIYGTQPFPLVSLRVDDDPDAVAALRRLWQSAGTDYLPYLRQYASPAEIDGVFGA